MISTTTTKTTTTLKLSGQDILDILSAHLKNNSISDGDIEFEVPRGGDYSGMAIDLTDDHYISVRYTEQS